MTKAGKRYSVPIAAIMTGIAWLFTTVGLLPWLDWWHTLTLFTVGFLTFLLGGFDKFTCTMGSWFLLAMGTGVARQAGVLAASVEVPLLVIALGLLVILVQVFRLPTPGFIVEPRDD